MTLIDIKCQLMRDCCYHHFMHEKGRQQGTAAPGVIHKPSGHGMGVKEGLAKSPHLCKMVHNIRRGARNIKKCPRGLFMTPHHNQLAKNGNGIKHEMLRKKLNLSIKTTTKHDITTHKQHF